METTTAAAALPVRPQQPLHAYLRTHARERPQHPACVWYGAAMSWAELDRASDAFGARLQGPGAWTTLFFMRALPIMPLSLISIAAGALRLPRRAYLLWTFLGSLPRCYLLAFLGWQAGSHALSLGKGVNRLESVGTLAVAALFVAVILVLRRRVDGDGRGG